MQKDKGLYTTDAYGRTIGSKSKNFDEEHMAYFTSVRQRPYEKFFEGYAVREFLENGHVRTVCVYTGTLYHQELTEKQARQCRALYAFIFVLSCMLFFAALLLPVVGNRCWYVMLCSFLTAIFYARVLLSLHTYVWSKPNLTIYEYNYGSIALQTRSQIGAISVLLPLISGAVELILRSQVISLLELVQAGLLILSGVVIGALKILEGRIQYTMIEEPEAQ